MEMMSIGEVARRTGLRTSALRYYEDAGLLPPPQRVNGRRVYAPGTVRMVEVLRFAQRAGFTLDEIRTLFHGFGAETPLSERWEALAQSKLTELDELIARAERMKEAIRKGLACGCVRVEDCVLPQGLLEVGRAAAMAPCTAGAALRHGGSGGFRPAARAEQSARGAGACGDSALSGSAWLVTSR